MGKRLLYTPNSKIKAALRMLFLRSRERGMAIKRDGYVCQRCGVKQSKAKGKEVAVEVHHKEGIANWQEVYDVIRKNLLCDPADMETLCKSCHGNESDTE
ncbi:MAG: HNH endonuclease [Alphaproteobacteria bacterium]